MTNTWDNDAQRQSIERALRIALASGELTWADPSLKDEEQSDTRVRELSELAMSLADLSDGDGSDLADPKPILHFDSSPSDNRPTSAWGMDAPAPVVADVATAEKPGFLSSKFQQVALTVVCVVLILMAAAFAGAQLIFAAMDAGSRPRPIGIVVPERPAEGSTGTVLVFPSRR